MIWGWIAGCWRRFARWHRSLRHGRPWWVRMGVWAVTAVVGFVLYLVAVNINFLWLFGKSPTIHSIMHPRPVEAAHETRTQRGGKAACHSVGIGIQQLPAAVVVDGA